MRGLSETATDIPAPVTTSPTASARPHRRSTVLRWILASTGWLFFFIALLVPLVRPSLSPQAMRDVLKVATLNIRFDASGGEAQPPSPHGSERPWAERRDVLVDQVFYEAPDIIGFQEVTDPQLQDLARLLGDVYGHVGVGRDDGKKSGEAVPIFYKRALFRRLGEARHFWLSKTPEKPGSIGWDAGLPRMATVLDLEPNVAQAPIAGDDAAPLRLPRMHIVNTHFDGRGIVSRAKASEVILDQLASEIDSKDLVLLTGDLNSPAEEDGYRVLTGFRYVEGHERSKRTTFIDTHQDLAIAKARQRLFDSPQLPFPRSPASRIPPLHGIYGESSTWTDFATSPEREDNSTIDFVMLADNQSGWTARQAAVLPNLFSGKPRLSDHRMVLTLLERDKSSSD